MLRLLDERIAMVLEHNETAWARKAAKQFAGELNHAKPISQNQANEIATDKSMPSSPTNSLLYWNHSTMTLMLLEKSLKNALKALTDPVQA